MTKIVCEVIKKINEDPGFDRALLFIFLPKMARYCAGNGRRVANDDSECIYSDIVYIVYIVRVQ